MVLMIGVRLMLFMWVVIYVVLSCKLKKMINDNLDKI